MVFSGVFVAWAGGFWLLWLYGQGWFLEAGWFGTNLRELFGVQPVALSVAVWVGFLALFGIATDDGVVLATIWISPLPVADPIRSTRSAKRWSPPDCGAFAPV